MTQEHLDSMIEKIMSQNNIENVNIEGVKKDYKFFSISSEIDEQLILNLLYRNMSQDIIRRNGSKRVSYYNANPEGSFVEYNKPREIREFLRQSLTQSFLSSILNPRQMENLISCLKPRIIEKDTIIITEDGIGNEMYVIENGSFEITKNNEMIEIRKRGVIGEMALLHSIRRTATVRTLETAKVWLITLEEYIAIYDTDNLNLSETFRACVAENKLFVNKQAARKMAKYAYLKKGTVLDNANYYVVVYKGGIIKNGENVMKLCLKDVVDEGIVKEDLEVFCVEKKYCNGSAA